MAKNVDPKAYVVNALKSVGREGMEELIAYMEEIGFFTAPCSGGNHLCKERGLVEHTMHVIELSQKLAETLIGKKNISKEQMDSVIISAALHDLGKCGQFGKPNYVPNMIKDGRPTKAEPEQKYKQSEAKPYTTNSDLLYVDHEIRSVAIATMFIDLTEDEQFAILYHNGLYGNLKYALTGHETWLFMIIHWADMWAAKIIE